MKTAIITGGTSGIGLATAKLFSLNNFNVTIVGRDEVKAQQAIKFLNSTQVHYVIADVRLISDCQKVFANVESLDVLVNSAGVYSEGAITDVEGEEFQRVIDTNLKGTFFMCQSAINALKQTKGSIINIASDAGIKGNYFCSLYSASKGAIISFTKSLALELSTIPIRVNCVAPGDVLTPMTENQIKLSGETIEDLASIYPLKRIATAEEVAESIYFLSTAQFITGTILSVDGGLTA